MLSVKTLSKDLEAIKISHKEGASLKKLKSDVESLYEKINMKGGKRGSKQRANMIHVRKHKSIIHHTNKDEYELEQRTQELYMMCNEVIKAFGSIPETKEYIKMIKMIKMVDNKNIKLNDVETEYILDKITKAYLDNSDELFGFNRISFLKTTTPTKPKYYKWDLEHRPEKLIPFSIAYGATKILEKKDKLDATNKEICLKMLLNSLAPEVSSETQSNIYQYERHDPNTGNITYVNRINRPATKSLYNKERKKPGEFTFKLYEKRGGKAIHSLTIEVPKSNNKKNTKN